MCANAAGRILPTFMIFEKSMPLWPDDNAQHLSELCGWMFAVTDTGINNNPPILFNM